MTRSYSVMNGMPKSSCICGIHVNTGTKIIGWILLLNILAIFGFFLYFINFQFNTKDYDLSDDEALDLKTDLFNGFLVTSIVGVVCVGLLLIGSYTRRPTLYWPYLICAFSTIMLFLGTVVLTGITTYRIYYNPEEHGVKPEQWDLTVKTGLVSTVCGFFFTICATYFVLIVPNRSREFLTSELD